jgi:hypothetical protein
MWQSTAEQIRFNIYHPLDAETELYAGQFSAVFLPERFTGAHIPRDDIPADLGRRGLQRMAPQFRPSIAARQRAPSHHPTILILQLVK